METLDKLLEHTMARCGPHVAALAEAAAQAAEKIAQKTGMNAERAALEAALLAASKCLGIEAPREPLAHDALEAAKLGLTGTALMLVSRLRGRRLHAALAAAIARQLAAAETIQERLCLNPSILEEALALSRLAGTARATALLAASEAGIRVTRDPDTGLPLAAYRRCPICGSKLDTSIHDAGCERPGRRLEQHCPTCGWKIAYTVCQPPPCPIHGHDTCPAAGEATS